MIKTHRLGYPKTWMRLGILLMMAFMSVGAQVYAGENMDPYTMAKFQELVSGVVHQDKLELEGIKDAELEQALLLEKAAIIEARRWVEEKVPRWRFGYIQRFGYDDNIFRDAIDAKSSFIFDQRPSAGLSYGLGKLIARADVSAGLLEYVHQPSQSRVDQNWIVTSHYTLGGKTGMDAYYSYLDTEEAPNSTESTPRRRQDDVFTWGVNHLVTPKISGHFRYNIRNSGFRKSTDKADGTETQSIETDLKYIISSKSNAFLHLRAAETQSERDRFNNDSYSIGGGIEGRLWPKTVVHLNAKGTVQDFEKTGKEFTGFTLEGLAYHSVSKKTSVQLVLLRDTEYNLDTVNSYFVSNLIAFIVNHQMTPRWGLSFTGTYRFNEHQGDIEVQGKTDTREDHVYTLGGAIEYKIGRLVSVGSSYTYTERTSVFDSKEYSAHYVTGQFKITL